MSCKRACLCVSLHAGFLHLFNVLMCALRNTFLALGAALVGMTRNAVITWTMCMSGIGESHDRLLCTQPLSRLVELEVAAATEALM